MMDLKAYEKRRKSLISVKIELTHIYPPNRIVFYKNTTTTSGTMEISTAPKHLIGSTMLSYIHILCELYNDFKPVVRFVNEDDENCMTLTVFNFDKKHLNFIKINAKRLGGMYYCKAKVSTISFEEHYSNVMTNKKFKRNGIYKSNL